jgi:thiamine-phosphate pyrophosphorylase
LIVPRLHIITDDATLASPTFARTSPALVEAGGARVALHVRGHATTAAKLFEIAQSLAGAAVGSGATLLVNDRVDVALCAAANGVHLGSRSVPVKDARSLLPHGLIGYSAHGVAEAEGAARDSADFVIAGAIWPTPTHPGAPGEGTQLLDEIARRVPVPVLAIGGVTPERVEPALRAGAHGVAVLSGVWSAADPVAALTEYLAALDAIEKRS